MRFWKYHGLGNDFILFEEREAPKEPEIVRRLCDRHCGIGADGILYIGESDRADVSMTIMNSDGSEAEMCGNGIRCLAKHIWDLTGFQNEEMTIETLAGLMQVKRHAESDSAYQVAVNMGPAIMDCQGIPMECEGEFIDGEIEIDGRRLRGTAVSMGNPHFVIFEDMERREQDQLAPLIESLPLFPHRTNVEFASLTMRGLMVRVFERGSGWTLACGTGACAVAVATVVTGRLPHDREIRVTLPGGDLWITVPRDLSSVLMRGPAKRVYEGEIDPGDLR